MSITPRAHVVLKGSPRPLHTFARRILLVAVGRSPQVVSETLYALIRGEPAFVPTELHIITTTVGAELVTKELLDAGRVRQLYADCGQDAILTFNERSIHVVHRADGTPLDDLRTAADNLAAADSIAALVRNFCADSSAAVHASIAGGRKTMAFFLGYALSLFGREQDRLSHVLINEPFESQVWPFFYPPAHEQLLRTRDGRTVSSSEAIIELVDVPFVRLTSNRSERAFSTFGAAYSDAVRGAQQASNGATPRPIATARRIDERRWEGSFALELIACRLREPLIAGHQLFETLARGLKPNQFLRFVYRVHQSPRRIVWTVGAGAVADSEREALIDTVALWPHLAPLLANDSRFLFLPIAPEDSRNRNHHCWSVIRNHVVLAANTTPRLAGTTRGDSALLASPIVFPRNRMQSVWEGLLNSGADAQVQVDLSAVTLEPRERERLQQLHNLALGGQAHVLEQSTGRRRTRAEIALLEPFLTNQLRNWVHLPEGIRISATLSAPGDTSTTQLLLIAHSLLPESHLVAHNAAFKDGESTLDLRNCFSAGAPLPTLVPHDNELRLSGIATLLPTVRAPMPEHGIALGNSGNTTVRLAPSEHLKHVFVLGATGTGKSTLLLNMLREDMAAGAGACLFDPHGDLYSQALACIPPKRARDVVLVDLGARDRVPAFNFLQCSQDAHDLEATVISNAMLEIFSKLYDTKEAGEPIFELYMRNALHLLMDSEIKGLTLLEAPLIFTDAKIRSLLVRRCKSPDVANFWTQIAEKTSGESALANMSANVLSKLHQFTQNAFVRPMIGQSCSTLDFRSFMDRGAIVLVNLNKGVLGARDAEFLGMLLLAQLSAATVSRADVELPARRPFSVYVDEFDTLATEDVTSLLLAEGRKYGLRLTLATQHLSQPRGFATGRQSLTQAILGNVGTLIAFRGGPGDAQTLAPYFSPELSETDLQFLPRFHAAVRMLIEPSAVRPFVMTSNPTPRPPVTGDNRVRRVAIDLIIARNRVRMTMPRSEVEQVIRQRHAQLTRAAEEIDAN